MHAIANGKRQMSAGVTESELEAIRNELRRCALAGKALSAIGAIAYPGIDSSEELGSVFRAEISALFEFFGEVVSRSADAGDNMTDILCLKAASSQGGGRGIAAAPEEVGNG